MSKYLIFLLLLQACFLAGTLCDLSYEMFRDAKYPGKCVIRAPDGGKHILDQAEYKKYPGRCAKIHCGIDGWALLESCDELRPPAGCHFLDYVDIELAYPDCCERVLICAH